MPPKPHLAMLVLLLAPGTASAVLTEPFTSWGDLTRKSSEIVIARCVTSADPMTVGDGMIWSDIEVLAVLKGEKPKAARMISLYWPQRDERFLMFANYETNELHGAYKATEQHRIVPLGRRFPISELAGKSLDEQIELVLRSRLGDVTLELESDAEEENRLEAGLGKSVGQASTVNPARRPQPAPYEIVLGGEHVVFDNPESVSIQITIRDLGVKKMIAPDLYWGLSVVWDGKEYKRDPRYTGSWQGAWEITPKSAWATGFSLSAYLVPPEVLTVGRHTIALKDAFAESNTLTVFVQKASAEQTAREGLWGEPVEGVSVRLRVEKIKWRTNELPALRIDVRNEGQREFHTDQAQQSGRLQVDGVWYEWSGGFDLKSSPLPPGREYDDIPVTLGNDWNATREWRDKTKAPPPQIPLKLLSGRHTIRFAPEIRDLTVKPKPHNIYVPSKLIEIEIEITDPSQASAGLPKTETDSVAKKFSVYASAAGSASNPNQIEMTVSIRNLSDKTLEIITVEGQQPFSISMQDERGAFIERDKHPFGKNRTQKESRLHFLPYETKTYKTPLSTVRDAEGKDVRVPVGIYLVEAVFPVVSYVDGKYVVELIRSAPVQIEINSKS